MYKLTNSKCVHKSPRCAHAKGASPIEMHAGLRKCRVCFPAQCLVCQCERGAHIACPCPNDHALCKACMLDYMQQVLQNAKWDGQLHCPCGHEAVFSKLAWTFAQKLCDRSGPRSGASPYRRSHLDVIEQDVLTSKCPHCSSAFLDFDGCCAIRCTCQKSFCGICMSGFDSDDECHRHVLACNSGNYFMDQEAWKTVHAQLTLRRFFRYLLSVFWETHSLLYVLGLLSLSARHLPWHALGPRHERMLVAGTVLVISGSILCI